MSNAVEITSSNYEAEVEKADKPVLVDFLPSGAAPAK